MVLTWDHTAWYRGPMKFGNRAMLKVYLEAADLDRFCARALAEGKATADYARTLILEHLNADSDGEPVRRDPPVRDAGRSAAVAGRSADSDEPVPDTPAEPPTVVAIDTKKELPKSAHPGAGVFNAPLDLFEPAYKSHVVSCSCALCESAVKAGLKEDRRTKKEEKKPPNRRKT